MLELRNISHTYSNRHFAGMPVLSDINLTVQKGEIVTLVGASGCGKTTLANIIAGYTQPTHGSVTINGHPVYGPGRDRIVVNQAHDLFDWMTVYQNMKLVSNDEQAISRYLSLVELSEYMHAYPSSLSGGMKKRLSLARALIVNPEFLIMDEPFSSLDYQLRERLQETLVRLIRAQRTTLIFITHDIQEAVFLADKVIVLSGKPARITADIDASSIGQVDDIRISREFSLLKEKIQDTLQSNPIQ